MSVAEMGHRARWQVWGQRWLLLAGLILGALVLYGLAAGERLARPAALGLAAGGGLVGSLALALFDAVGRRRSAGFGPTGEALVLAEAQRLRTMRERARAIHEMTTTLSATLNHRRVLEDAQNIGTLSLRDDLGPDVRLVSAVLLFQGEKLRVITARGLTATDQNATIDGKRGVLGLALKQTRPVFGGAAIDDPELRYIVGFQGAKSVLAIPLGVGFDLFGAMIFGCDRPNAFSDDHVELMTAIGTQSTLALQNASLYQNLLDEKEKIVAVEESARKKLARDLHDGPTQSVAAIAMRANYIRRLIERQPQQAIEELWKVEDLARRTTKEIRHMLFTLRPLVLENQGLVAALQQLAEKMKDTHNTVVLVQAKPEIDTLIDTNAQGVLFYIIEEAVNNARKHAQSDQIIVRLYRQEKYVISEVEDHGVGFDVDAVETGYDRRGSLGMINMRERAELIEGQLHIASTKGKGTTISIRVPVDRTSVSSTATDEAPIPPLKLQSQREARQVAASMPTPAPAEAQAESPTEPILAVPPPAAETPAVAVEPSAPELIPPEAPEPRAPTPAPVSRPDTGTLGRRTVSHIRGPAGSAPVSRPTPPPTPAVLATEPAAETVSTPAPEVTPDPEAAPLPADRTPTAPPADAESAPPPAAPHPVARRRTRSITTPPPSKPAD